MTRFAVWLLQLGIEVIHGRVRHPQTQGKEERFHRTLKTELLLRSLPWKDHAACQKSFNQWREIYNHERPHEALDYQCPGEVYKLSHRPYPMQLPAEESYYLDEDIIRRVKSKGEITFQNTFFYIGRAFIGRPIALRPLGGMEGDTFGVYFCWKQLGTINLRKINKPKGRYHPLDPA